MAPTTIEGYLGIDNGTQGLSVIFTDKELKVLATAESPLDFIGGLPEGCYEHHCQDWDDALTTAMKSLREKLAPSSISVLSIGISGQMHGEVLVDASGTPIQPARLWCDARNETEGHELTAALGTKIPKRATSARFLWTVRNRPDVASRTAKITTPAGWLAFRLTGEFVLGVGDAAGMFPIDPSTHSYDKEKLLVYDSLVCNRSIPPLASLLPKVRCAGEDAGYLCESGATLLGIPFPLSHAAKIPVAAAEGDQVAALAGSLIGRAGTVSCSFGTSVCANIVGDRPFQGVSPSVDHFCAADGKPINMVWLRNGTTFLNMIVKSYGYKISSATDASDAFNVVIPELVAAPTDCGGLLALPFMNDEPGLEVSQGGSALIVGWTPVNANVGNVAKAALLSTMFNLRLGCSVLDRQGYARTELVLTGGLSKTPECGQILANVFNTPVTLLASADEGCSWGASVLAKYRHARYSDADYADDWPTFLDSVSREEGKIRFTPDGTSVSIYNQMFERYQRLIKIQPELTQAVNG